MQGNLYSTTVGKKIVMALTGMVMLVFVVGHMAGNLKMFGGIGPDGLHKMDHYAIFLRNIGADMLGEMTFLWLFRGLLVVCVIVHVATAWQLRSINTAAKPIGYRAQQYEASNLASRTMWFGGLFLLCFIVAHILHFTTGHLHARGFVEGRVYDNVVSGFESGPAGIFYILAMVALAFHVFHGFWSLFQTLGLDSPRCNPMLRTAAKVVAVLLFIGFSSIPVAVMSGFLTARPQMAFDSRGELLP